MIYIPDSELVETVIDVSESIDDRKYALQILKSRETGYDVLVSSKDVFDFTKNKKTSI